jgi:hypothetical protein
VFVDEFSLEERMKLRLMNEMLWMKLTLPIIGMDLSVSGRKGPSRGKFCQRRLTAIRKEKFEKFVTAGRLTGLNSELAITNSAG